MFAVKWDESQQVQLGQVERNQVWVPVSVPLPIRSIVSAPLKHAVAEVLVLIPRKYVMLSIKR